MHRSQSGVSLDSWVDLVFLLDKIRTYYCRPGDYDDDDDGIGWS